MNTRKYLYVAAVAAMGVSAAHGVSLVPGQAKLIASASSGAFEGSQLGSTQLISFATSTFSGTLEAQAWKLGSGTVDFFYRVHNDASSGNAIHRFVVTGFAGYLTDVSYVGSGAGTHFPHLADRSSGAGDNVGFDFANGTGLGGLIVAGSTSKYVRVRTNATAAFAAGTASIINSKATTVTGVYAPVPEPMTLGLAGAALLAAARRRRSRGASA